MSAADLSPVLADLLGVPVEMEERPAADIALRDLPSLAGPPESPSVGVYLHGEDGPGCQMLLVFPREDARALGELLMGPGVEAAAILDVCREVGNVLAGCYLSEIADRRRGRLTPTTPQSTVDMAGAIISSVLAASPPAGIRSLSIRLQAPDRVIGATLLLLEAEGDT